MRGKEKRKEKRERLNRSRIYRKGEAIPAVELVHAGERIGGDFVAPCVEFSDFGRGHAGDFDCEGRGDEVHETENETFFRAVKLFFAFYCVFFFTIFLQLWGISK